MKTIDFKDNTEISKGVFKQVDGTYLALRFSQSKVFKTLAGAKRFING